MRRLRARAISQRLGALALTTMLACSLAVAGTLPAAADPTPTAPASNSASPGPKRAAPGDRSSAAPPTAASKAEPTNPDEESTTARPRPRANSAKTRSADLAKFGLPTDPAELAGLPVDDWIRVRDLARQQVQARSESERAEADEAPIVIAMVDCASGAQLATGVLFLLSLTDDPISYDWRIRQNGVITTSGTVDVDGYAFAEFEGLRAGPGDLELLDQETGAVVADVDLLVLTCVKVTVAACQATISNPSSNPDVVVYVGDERLFTEDGDEEEPPDPDAEIELAPGESRTLLTARTSLGYGAASALVLEEPDDDAPPQSLSYAGDAVVKPAPCNGGKPLFAMTGLSCAGAGHQASTAVRLPEPFTLDDVEINVVDYLTGDLATTLAGGDGRSAVFPLDLNKLGPGRYDAELTTDDGSIVVDRVSFALVDCVTVKVHCGSVSFHNPKDNPAITIRYGTDPGPGNGTSRRSGVDGTIKVSPGATKKIHSDRSTLSWYGTGRLPRDEDDPDAPRDVVGVNGHQVSIRSACGAPAQTSPAGFSAADPTGPTAQLADTGLSSIGTWLVCGGLGSLVSGLLVLLMLVASGLRLRR